MPCTCCFGFYCPDIYPPHPRGSFCGSFWMGRGGGWNLEFPETLIWSLTTLSVKGNSQGSNRPRQISSTTVFLEHRCALFNVNIWFFAMLWARDHHHVAWRHTKKVVNSEGQNEQKMKEGKRWKKSLKMMCWSLPPHFGPSNMGNRDLISIQWSFFMHTACVCVCVINFSNEVRSLSTIRGNEPHQDTYVFLFQIVFQILKSRSEENLSSWQKVTKPREATYSSQKAVSLSLTR